MNTTIRIEDAGVLEKLRAFPGEALRAIAREMNKQNELTLSTIIQERLSFSRDEASTLEGLRVQSNRLRSSMRRGDSGNISEAATIENGIVTSAIGTNVDYAGVHEYGWQGTQQVGGYTRRAVERLSFAFGGKSTKRTVQGADIFVRPHDRQVNFPARRFMGRVIEARMSRYVAALGEAVTRAWNNRGGANA